MELTKEQAIAAMKEGKKLRHRLFSDNEWATIKDAKFLFEDGVKCSPAEFWFDRTSTAFETGWSIVEETTKDKHSEFEGHTPHEISFIERGIKLRENLSLADTLSRLYKEYCEEENIQLRSELAKQKKEIAIHIAVNSLLLDNEGEEDLANKLYQCQSDLAKQKELKDELVNGLRYIKKTLGSLRISQDTPEGQACTEAELLIKKANEI